MKEKSFLFDLKGRINYILEFCKKANNNEKTNNNCYILITYAKDSNNFLIDRFFDQFTEDKNYKNIILVRRTEFGNSFSDSERVAKGATKKLLSFFSSEFKLGLGFIDFKISLM